MPIIEVTDKRAKDIFFIKSLGRINAFIKKSKPKTMKIIL
jgi:hypothetical protein